LIARNAALQQEGAHLIDDTGTLADQPLTNPMQCLQVKLLGATIFLLRGVASGQASVLVPIAQVGFIVAALLGIFILREPVTVRKAMGLVSALAALAVLAWS
jgi:multidrug transporter EmrE-like cation transporter